MRFYTRALRWTLEHVWIAPIAAAAFLLVAWVAYGQVESGFIPAMDEGAFIVDYWSPPGTSLQETVRLLRQVDDVLQHTPEVMSFSRRTGAELGILSHPEQQRRLRRAAAAAVRGGRSTR